MSTEPSEERVILVDEGDRPVGEAGKASAHRGDLPLHRAFSVYLFDERGHMLVTRRSGAKVTWPGFWSNACCSHPRPGEATEDAARRRLGEELGITADLRALFSFVYEARYDETWGEHELDHVLVGTVDMPLAPNPAEVADWRFLPERDLARELAEDPERFTPWFRLSVDRVLAAREA